jgi:hypothetical protein
VTLTVKDPDGETATDTLEVHVNNVAPQVTAAFASPTGSCGENNVTLNYSFTDPGDDTHSASINWGDGPSQAIASVAKNTNLSTQHTYGSAGMKNATITITETDGDSVNDSDTDADNAVTVDFTLIDGGVLQPINRNGTTMSVFKYKSTIPVKIKPQDCDGSFPSDLAPQIKINKIDGGVPSGLDEAILSTSGADTGTTMRWAGGDSQYIYNLAGQSLSDKTATYRIKITIPATGQVITADFGLKQ